MFIFRTFCAFSSALIAADVESGFSLENWLVRAYLKNAAVKYQEGIGREGISILDYNTLGTETSYYCSKVDTLSPNWAEQPAAVRLNTKGGDSLFVSAAPDFSGSVSYSVKEDTTSVYNLIPQRIYWYKVVNSLHEIVSRGLFKTLGHVRMVYSPNVCNIRDIGGWKCETGRLAYGKIFRGGALEGATDEDKNLIMCISGISTDVDLRHDDATTGEHGNTQSPFGINYKWYELLAYMYLMTNTWSYTSHSANTGYYYIFGNLIRYIVDNPTAGAFYIHCTAGADRTGIVMALLEALCGVSEEDIVKDWELTTFSNYEKFINVEKTSWNHKDSEGNQVKETGEMRHVLQYLYDNFGGANNATLQQQAEKWFKTNVFVTAADQKKYINGIKSYLIEADSRTPMIVKNLSDETICQYSVTDSITSVFDSKDTTYVSTESGKEVGSDFMTSTDYIDCSDYTYLLSNVKIKNLAAFYDSNFNFLGGIGAQEAGEDDVLFEDNTIEYSIPSGAAYMKLNMPRDCGSYAVLSVDSLL